MKSRLVLIILATIAFCHLTSCAGMAPLVTVRVSDAPMPGWGGQPHRPHQTLYRGGNHSGGYNQGGYGHGNPYGGGYSGGHSNGGYYQQQRPPVAPNGYGSRNGSMAHWGPAPIIDWNETSRRGGY